jgi:predicted RNA-binding protein with PIN domain
MMQDLARLAALKKMRLAVVFDGAPDQRFPDGSRYRGVKIFYSRQGSDADTRIVEMVEAERDKKGMVVVTSDRKLASRVRVCGVRVMRSGEFRRMLDEILQTSPEAGGAMEVKDEEMDEWLRYFGVSVEGGGEN